MSSVPPANPDPVEPDPVEPDPVEPDPVEPDPVEPDPVEQPPDAGGRPGADPRTLTRDDVAHLAHLARLELTGPELDLYVGQLSVILDAVAAVSTLTGADADIEPTSHAVPLTNVYRDDVVRPGLRHEAALAGAPAVEQGRFRVPQILGEEQ